MFQVSSLIGEAYGRVATVRNATNAFKSSGLWPINRNIFNGTDFTASIMLAGLPKSELDSKITSEAESKISSESEPGAVASSSKDNFPSMKLKK